MKNKDRLIAFSTTDVRKRLRAGLNDGSRRRIESGLQMFTLVSSRAALLWRAEV
jgi:hypothetical protein